MPSIADICIIAVVAAACALAVRNIARTMKEGSCSSCSSAPSCAATTSGGDCPITGDLVEKMDLAAQDALSGRN